MTADPAKVIQARKLLHCRRCRSSWEPIERLAVEGLERRHAAGYGAQCPGADEVA